MVDFTQQCRALHHTYLACTGLKPHLFPFTTSKMWFWERFIAKGWSPDDLALVIRGIQREIRTGQRNRGALKFQNLVENIQLFESDLAFYSAQEEHRKRKPPTDRNKSKALQATGREHNLDELRGVKTYKEVMESKEFKDFSELGRRLATELLGAKPENKPADPGTFFE